MAACDAGTEQHGSHYPLVSCINLLPAAVTENQCITSSSGFLACRQSLSSAKPMCSMMLACPLMFGHQRQAQPVPNFSTHGIVVADSWHNLSYADGMQKIRADQRPLIADSCPADVAIAVGTCPASSHNESVGSQGGKEWTDTSPGYLLAVKLWREAIATDAAASRKADLQKYLDS